MAMKDLGPAEYFAAGAVGEPGQRHFYLEVAAAGKKLWFPAEKQQVATLGAQSLTLLTAGEIEPDLKSVADIRADLSISAPDEESFPVGSIQIAILESELISVVLTSIDQDETVRFLVAPEQLQAMAEYALEIVAAGRPICPRCQLPEEPEGHRCPSTNGHHPS